jgi:glycerol-3-phosphate dehydrogenase
MLRDFSRLQNEKFDVIIIGGGIIGSGIARDASLRGLKTLLVEKNDFASGTTSRSTRLIHGGLRYLGSLQFKLVHQDLIERETLLLTAPHLVKRQQFIIPLDSTRPLFKMALPLGLWLYDRMAKGQPAPHSQKLSLQDALAKEPCLKNFPGLQAAFLYQDSRCSQMERLCLENLIDAADHEACLLNYASVSGLTRTPNRLFVIPLKDQLNGQTYNACGKMIIIAAGHWTDEVWQQFNITRPEKLRRTKGIHLVCRKLSQNALTLFAKSDGRLFFVIPWSGFSLIGTTDSDYSGDIENVSAAEHEVAYLIEETARYFPDFSRKDIFYTSAGLRPLVAEGNKSASQTSRAHKLINHTERGAENIISVLGGKITAHRIIAEETIDLACRKLGVAFPCRTAQSPLPGSPAVLKRNAEKAAAEYKLPPATVIHLAATYGSKYKELLEFGAGDPHLWQPVSQGRPDCAVQIKWAVQNEEALTLSDFMLRRSQMGFASDQGRGAAEATARVMAEYRGWDEQQIKEQVAEFLKFCALGQLYRQTEV